MAPSPKRQWDWSAACFSEAGKRPSYRFLHCPPPRRRLETLETHFNCMASSQDSPLPPLLPPSFPPVFLSSIYPSQAIKHPRCWVYHGESARLSPCPPPGSLPQRYAQQPRGFCCQSDGHAQPAQTHTSPNSARSQTGLTSSVRQRPQQTESELSIFVLLEHSLT